MIVFFELPYYILVFSGILRYIMRRREETPYRPNHFPRVSCIVTCYSEGRDIQLTIRSVAHQLYQGHIQIIVVLDGASVNKSTYHAAYEMIPEVGSLPDRELLILPKWQRGGRVSSLNAGMSLADGDVIMSLDGDSSFDNNMVANSVRHFADERVVALSGGLRVRNWRDSPVAALQGLEYMLSIVGARTGLSEFNTVNIISGAFGVFSRSFLELLYGWDSGTAEDLDITMRLKNYFGRHKGLRILFDPEVMGHTDSPDTLRGFFKQRLRWDGDLFYLYFRKHWLGFTPRLIGWPNFIVTVLSGLFFQIVTPMLLLLYTFFLLLTAPLWTIMLVMGLVYCFYFVIGVLFYFLTLFFLSERPEEDKWFLPLLPIMPIFMLASRVWSAFAVLWEIIGKAHMDSTMAPQWVLRKGKF
ncbi:MAG: glycosyltransferase family 2 protein [Synergistaceae bacterium]|nr:glycosyltransferase family 2 protein [Synergistaceae bacterium]